VIHDLILKNRSCRRFREDYPINEKTLLELVDLARLSASSGNMQPLKYILSCEARKNAFIFSHLRWAGYFKNWPGPGKGERPSAYIVILGDTRISQSFDCDHGIAAQSILLGASEMGLGGCMIGSIDRDGLRKALKIASYYKILLALALGKPEEKAVIETVKADNGIKYWRDARGVHHVPKRKLGDITLG